MRPPALSLALFASIGSLAARPIHAAPPPPSPSSAAKPPPVLVPPKLVFRPAIAPPKGTAPGAHETVVLRVVVGVDGGVLEAKVDRGDEPWATAALDRANDLRFEPATRDGVPINAIVRIETTFTSVVVPDATPTAETPVPRAPLGIREVTVQGERAPVGATTLTRAEVRELPGAFGDPFRAIEALPGVTPIVSGVPYFYVRGAPPGNVGYFLDGIRVPALFHIGFGPSVVHPGMVDHVDLHPGGYPARFGRFGGGVVAGETAGPRKDFHGEANIRLFDAGALVESGFADGKGSILVGGRYSYTAAMVSLLAEDTVVDYRDAQLRIAYDLTPKDRISVFAFASYDLLGEDPNDKLRVLFGSEFYRADLRYDRVVDADTQLRQAVTLGFDRTRIADGQISENVILGTRIEVTRAVRPDLRLRAGADILSESYGTGLAPRADPDDPDIVAYQAKYGTRVDRAMGVRGDVLWTPHALLEVVPGARVDVFQSRGVSAVGVDPRLAGRVGITKRTRLLVAMGMAHQPPSFVAPVPGVQPAGLAGGLQRSFQQSFGIETDLPSDVLLRVTAYTSAFFRLSDALGSAVANRGNDDVQPAPAGPGGPSPPPPERPSGSFEVLERRSLGVSRGLELFLHRKLSRRFGGFVSYTLGQSIRSVARATFPAAFDRRHVFNAVASIDLGRRWRAGGRFVFYTGIPTQGSDAIGADPPREPSFYRLDLRLEKRWRLGAAGSISFVAEMLNTTLNKEFVGGEAIGPVSIPSIGAEAFF